MNRKKNASRSEVGRYVVAICLCLYVLVLLTSLPGHAAQQANDRVDLYAVVIGVSKYEDPSIPTLNLAATDATDFADFVRGCEARFGKTHVTLLTDEMATRANVTKALRDDLRTAREQDIVIIYLSGHGAPNPDPSLASEFYFITYDARPNNLYATAVRMNDPSLLNPIKAKGMLLVADTCYSWGFVKELDARPKSMGGYLGTFEKFDRKYAIASSDSGEMSYEQPQLYKNSIFTHFLLKGLKGEADTEPRDGQITVKKLYDYVASATRQATQNKQNPKCFPQAGPGVDTVIFKSLQYSEPLTVDVQFQYLDKDATPQPLTDGAELRSGDGVGVAFRPHSDCYVYIYWWDSSGKVGELFPNIEMTDGDAKVKEAKTYWLPIREGEDVKSRWFQLDRTPGQETIYFVASRERNSKLEDLYSTLQNLPLADREGSTGKNISGKMEREIRLMGFEKLTAVNHPKPKSTGNDRAELFEAMKNEVNSSGAEKVLSVTFKHLP